jgi:ketosteroid isomerase-like protein
MNRNEIETLVRKLYETRVDGDIDALSQLFAEDATFQIAGSPEYSMLASLAEGHETVMSLMRTIVDTFSLSDVKILDLLVDGDKAAVRWRATVHVMTTGQTVTTEIAAFVEIADGKVVSLIEFVDTALA